MLTIARPTAMRTALFFMALFFMSSVFSAETNKAPNCMPVEAMKAELLFGSWEVRYTHPPDGLPATATLLLERHAEFSDSLAGVVRRDLGKVDGSVKPLTGPASQAALAGDFEAGLLLLDESSDNLSITATWDGEMVKGSCATAFQGVWKDLSSSAKDDAPGVPFTLRKLP